MTPSERMQRFFSLQQRCWEMMSDEGKQKFFRRNNQKRRVKLFNGKWQPVVESQFSQD